ncbi:hypothetical protein C8Q73DRAFT_89047 [Cubamyces lactineus]|nr:hypothetical protein C8Q73DRAFT_89047 [Cubamyces lactineus]
MISTVPSLMPYVLHDVVVYHLHYWGRAPRIPVPQLTIFANFAIYLLPTYCHTPILFVDLPYLRPPTLDVRNALHGAPCDWLADNSVSHSCHRLHRTHALGQQRPSSNELGRNTQQQLLASSALNRDCNAAHKHIQNSPCPSESARLPCYLPLACRCYVSPARKPGPGKQQLSLIRSRRPCLETVTTLIFKLSTNSVRSTATSERRQRARRMDMIRHPPHVLKHAACACPCMICIRSPSLDCPSACAALWPQSP